MELKEIEAIKEGSFKKITVQYFHQEKESQINCIHPRSVNWRKLKSIGN